MAIPLGYEREQQEGELDAEEACGVEIERRDSVEVVAEEKLGQEELVDEEEEEEDEKEEEEEVEKEEAEEEEAQDEEDYYDEEEEVFSSERGDSEEGDDKEEEASSRVRVLFKFKRNPPSVIVKYNEDGEQVQFERQGTSDQTESDSDEEEDVEEEEDEVEAGRMFRREFPGNWRHFSSAVFPAEFSPAEIMENVTARTGVGAIGVRSPGTEINERLYVVNDHDSYVPIAIAFPEVEERRVNANRSIMIKLMAQSAQKIELPPCGLYLAVLLLDFYWNHDRSQGRRMDSVQLHVLAFTCLYIASNRFRDPGLARTPDGFCKWVGVAEGSVKGCMIIRQLEAFEKLLCPENVSSVTCQFLWNQLKQFSSRLFRPELHMSDFIMDLEQTEYGIANFSPPAAVEAARAVYTTHMLMAAKLNDPTKFEDPSRAMQRMLLLASRATGNKRGGHDIAIDDASLNLNKRPKIISLPKIVVL